MRDVAIYFEEEEEKRSEEWKLFLDSLGGVGLIF